MKVFYFSILVGHKWTCLATQKTITLHCLSSKLKMADKHNLDKNISNKQRDGCDLMPLMR